MVKVVHRPNMTFLLAIKVGQVRPAEVKCFIRVVELAPPLRAGSLIRTQKPSAGSAFNSGVRQLPSLALILELQ